jgi:GDP-4-dehydro-6-deoxy-D-mannose reductase
MKKTALITGINGFVGKHLAEHLLAHGRIVHGIDVQDATAISGVGYACVNICDVDAMQKLVAAVNPDELYHLAAVSSPSGFHRTPYSSFQINIMGTIAVFESMRIAVPHAVLLVIGSAKQYQAYGEEMPLRETSIQNPASFYGISKYTAEILGRYYVKEYALDIRFSRSFNHTGPGQSSDFVVSDWSRQIAGIQLGKHAPELDVGDISAAIDFTDVRDVVRAYRMILENGSKGESYNVCSGKAVPLEYILNYLKKKCSVPVAIKIQARKAAKSMAPGISVVGDAEKICTSIGWKPELPIEKTLDDTCAWWVENLKNS